MRSALATTALALILAAPGLAVAQQQQQQPQADGTQIQGQQPAPDVTVEQSAPSVTTEQTGQPDVQVEQPGQAAVDAETPDNQQAGNAAGMAPASWYADMRGEEVVGKTLYGADGEELGTVDNVVMSQDDQKPAVLVGVGGFLGIGERQVAVPLDRLSMEGDRLVTGVTRDELGNMEPYEAERYRMWDSTRPLGGGMAP
jgi:sporulation protein YlmC with PRC-barrel domain